jgi:hypothetical protein
MLHLARKVRGATVRALDGDIGTLDDFYFEESRWAVRYLVVDTGTWLSSRKVLVSPMSVRGPWSRTEISVHLQKEQIKESPDVDPGKLTRSNETMVHLYYGHPVYWGGNSVWGMFETPAALLGAPKGATVSGGVALETDPEELGLRSVRESTGYHIHATDGEIGHVDDFLIEEESWRIRYLQVDTSNWIGGRSVVVATGAVREIDRGESILRVGVTREAIKNSPTFDSIESAISLTETGPPFVII